MTVEPLSQGDRSSRPYSKTIHARWGDMDFNGHMRNTAYLDAAGDIRINYFADHGFTAREFERLKLGPVILRDELEYFREVHLLEEVEVQQVALGLSADFSHYRLCNEFWRVGGGRVARVVSNGGWLDLESRRLTVTPAGLLAVVESMPRASGFGVLESLVRR
jgi:acyl-CoA thioester hydrolase